MVTGVLPLALEDATKTIQVFLLTGKEYVCLMTMHGDVDETRLRGVLEEFVGDIFQKPPVRPRSKGKSGKEQSTRSMMWKLMDDKSSSVSLVKREPTSGNLSTTSGKFSK